MQKVFGQQNCVVNAEDYKLVLPPNGAVEPDDRSEGQRGTCHKKRIKYELDCGNWSAGDHCDSAKEETEKERNKLCYQSCWQCLSKFKIFILPERKCHCHYDGRQDSRDRLLGLVQPISQLKNEINQAQDEQEHNQPRPRGCKQRPGNVTVFAAPTHGDLDGCHQPEVEGRQVDKRGVMEAWRKVRVGGVPRQVHVPEGRRAEPHLVLVCATLQATLEA